MKNAKRKYGTDKTTGCPTKAFGHDRQCGFTLVELVIVIAIVIILSVISVPIYRGYVDKAKMSEAYALLGTILSAQKAYYSEYGNFLRYQESSSGSGNILTCNETVLGIDARGNKYFTSFGVGPGEDAGEIKYYLWAMVKCDPNSLAWGNNHTRIYMQYNLTSGHTFYE